jgi:hypothetical protein
MKAQLQAAADNASASLKSLSDLIAALPDDQAPPPPLASPFDDKTYYPAGTTINIVSTEFEPASKVANVKIALDAPTPKTVVASILTKNGTITGGYTRISQPIIFRPGDPLEQTVTINFGFVHSDGAYISLYFPTTPQGAKQGTSARITARTGAVPQPPIEWKGRAARTFNPTGALQFDLDVPNMKWANAGTGGVWNTALAHGRTQPGNNETGLYLDGALHPSAEPPHRIDGNTLVLHTQKLAEMLPYGGTYYAYGSSVLTGQKIPATQLLFGQYEIEAMMPDRRDSWPALWFLGVGGWPPEFDMYEGFGYNGSFNLASTTSTTIHGGEREAQTFAPGAWINASQGGFTPDLTTQFHKWQADIQPDYITVFVDGKEVYQFVNPFLKETWYPLMNVAVRTSGDYADGSGDMRVRSFRVWKS